MKFNYICRITLFFLETYLTNQSVKYLTKPSLAPKNSVALTRPFASHF